MPEFKTPKNELEFERNFDQIKPLMNKTEAIFESSRCLFCYDAPCIKVCPTKIDIPLFIRQINNGNVKGAAKTIFNSNYLGNTCGKVCPTEVLCEGSCVYINEGVKAIEIGRLQNFATNFVIKDNIKIFSEGKSVNKKVAIIGGGPAGLSCACELRLNGIEVDIYEGKSKATGLAIHGIAPYKIANQEVDDELEYLRSQFGFNIHFNHYVHSDEELRKIEKEYDAIFIGVGNANTTMLKIPGEDKKNVIGAIEIIEQLRLKHHKTVFGNKVIVLGGGNTAMDAASEASRMGSESVVLAYRRAKEDMKGYEFEFDLAKSVGVKAMFNVAPVEIIGDDKVTGIKFIKTKTENGVISNIKGSEFIEECDMIIKATGQSKHFGLLQNIENLKTDDEGRIIVNEGFQTTNPKYFAGGDAVNGGKEVVNSVAEGKTAGKNISKMLLNKN